MPGTHVMLLGAALVSLVGVVLAFLKANETGHPHELLLEGVGVFTIACSWVARAHRVRAAVRARVLHTADGWDRLQERTTSDPTTATSRTPRSPSA